MPEQTKTPRGDEPREALKVCLLAGERAEGSLNLVTAQACADRKAARAHQAATLKSFGADRAGELALSIFYKRRAAALMWSAAA